MSQGSPKGRNAAFDRLRGLAALSVVMIHAPPLRHSGIPILKWTGWALLEWNQCAVAFFFVLSGWLLGERWRSGRRDSRDLLRGMTRIAWLYVPWFAAYLLLDIALGAPHDPVSVARRFVGLADKRSLTYGYHLWFLPSLLLAQLACWTSVRLWGGMRPALAAGWLVYLGLGLAELGGFVLPWGLEPHGLVAISLPAVASGAALRFESWKFPRPGWLAVAGFLLVVPEGLFLNLLAGTPLSVHPYPILRIALPLLVVAHFADGNHPTGGSTLGKVSDFLGRHSSAIYVMHVAVLVLVPFQSLVPNGFVRDNLVRWPVAILVPSAISAGLRRFRSPTLDRLL